MTALDSSITSAAAVSGLAANFMLDGATYARGAELGFQGIDFYGAGRGGVLGDVPADVVTAALVFFNPEVVRQAWENSRDVMPRAQAAAEFAACGHAWGENHLPDDLDASRLAELAGRVAAAAPCSGAPIFAGWRLLPVPESSKAAALHQMNAMRELRFAFHGAAIVASGLRAADAVRFRSPHMAAIFGWVDPMEEGRADEIRPLWDEAEAATNRAMAAALDVLDDTEQKEFCELAMAAHAATS